MKALKTASIISFVLWTLQYVSGNPTAWDLIEIANLKAAGSEKLKNEIIEFDIKLNYASSSDSNSNQQDAATRFSGRLWTGAVIPYTFARNIQKITRAKQILKEAFTDWETSTCIRFVERTNEVDYVEFAIGGGCNADVGKIGGKQTVSLGDGCMFKSVIVHEIGHVIGFWHEQNRPDRDEYVTIYTDNIKDLYKPAFAKFNNYRIDSLNIPYDYYSIMHYGIKAFSKNQMPTILPKKSGVLSLGNDELSPLDIQQTMKLYKCQEGTNDTWTKWSRWSTCDKSCNSGSQKRIRVCASFKDGVKQCEGPEVQRRICNMQDCPDWPNFPFEFSFQQIRSINEKDYDCILVYERADYEEWSTVSFCNKGKRKIHMRWSDQGPVNNMKCTQIFEPKEDHRKRWYDNYLCIPHSAPYNFTWSFNGPVKDLVCIQWYAKEGRDGWNNNYLCATEDTHSSVKSVPAIDGGWGAWTPWSKCNKKCGGGVQRRLRLCNNPVPMYGGRACQGSIYSDQECNSQPCPQCGRVLRGNKGEFYSPNYPSNYPSYTNCTWTIEGNKRDQILLSITSFDFEKLSEQCKFDYLIVRDNDANGRTLGLFCGREIPLPIFSLGSRLWLNMVTDGQENKAGFRASWELKEREAEGCGGLIRSTQGNVSSPNFPETYPPEKSCIWLLEVPEGYYIRIKFIHFDLERHSICKYDSLEVRDGWNRTSLRIGRYCGLDPVKSVLKTGTNRAMIKFHSDNSSERSGFKLSWKAQKQRSTKPFPIVLQDNIPFSKKCDIGWRFFEHTMEGGACYRVKRNYFNWYGARDDCLSNSADLVSVTTDEEQNFIKDELLLGKYMWLGMSDERSEGRWSWSDNTTTTSFINWDDGDPNNGGLLQNEDCALIKPNGKWNDYPCIDRFNYICKKKPRIP